MKPSVQHQGFTVEDAYAVRPRGLTLKQVAWAAFPPAWLLPGLEPAFHENANYAPKRDSFPNGCVMSEVEIDPQNRRGLLADMSRRRRRRPGYQSLGARRPDPWPDPWWVARGLGRILMEQVVYERGSGRLLTASFTDCETPRADTMCSLKIVSNPMFTATNPLGTKGPGEAGCVGALPAVMIAIMNAMTDCGVRELDRPATSERIRNAIRSASKTESGA